MNVGAVSSLLRRAGLGSRCVRQVEVPARARSLTTLPRVAYADAFLLETETVYDRTGEQWARTVMDGAPEPLQRALHLLLSTIALDLGPIRGEDVIAGWEIRRTAEDFALLGANALSVGLSAELLFRRQQDGLVWATFVQQDKAVARALWSVLAPVHRQVVPYALESTGAPSARTDQPQRTQPDAGVNATAAMPARERPTHSHEGAAQ